MTEELDSLVLANGLKLHFVDQSNRYFGDFHRICIKVQIALPDTFELPSGLTRETAFLEKTLEKMGVTTDVLDEQRKALIDSFLAASRSYLEKNDFPKHLLLKIQQKKPKSVFLRKH
jgi:hypothetical protein